MLAGGFLQDHRDTTAPLLDQAEFAEHATDHAIAQAADPARGIFEAQAGDEHTWISISIRSAIKGLLSVSCEHPSNGSRHSEEFIAASEIFAKIRSSTSRLLHGDDCWSDAPRLLQLLPITWVDQAG